MELLDRYLNAVRFWLPGTQQDDIIAELGDDIRSQIEERESSLGRRLDDDDLAVLLKQRGHPMLMASRYLPQQSLIGPVLYPAYLVVLRIVVLWVLVPVFILIVGPLALATAASPTMASIQTLWNLAMSAVFSVGVVTVVFAILERSPRNDLLKWDPHKLPHLPRTKPQVDPGKPIPRATAIAELIFGVILTGVCIQAGWVRGGFDLGNGVHVTLAPIWRLVYWFILLTFMAGIPLGWTGLLWPTRTRLRAVMRLTIDAVTFIVIGVLTKTDTWMTLTAPVSAARLAEPTKWVNLGMKIALASAAIVTLVDVATEVRRFYGARGAAIEINR